MFTFILHYLNNISYICMFKSVNNLIILNSPLSINDMGVSLN